MADIFDEIAASVSSPASGGVEAAPQEFSGDIFDKVAASVRPDPTGAIPVLGKIGNGLSLGWLNEIQGLSEASANEVVNLFGGGNEKPFWENYSDIRDYYDDIDDRYRKANPGTSLALEVAGGAAPSLFSGGVSLLTTGAAKTAPGLVGSVGRNLFGVGIEEAPTLFNLAKMGAVQGGVYGAGEAKEGQRILGGVTGAGVGAVAAPVVGKSIEYGVNAIADQLANKGVIGAGADLMSERGSFSTKPGGVSYLPEDLILAKQLKNTPMSKVTAGADEMAETIASDSPLFLPEALQSPKVDRNARFIANYEPSLEYSQTQIGNRAADAEDRVTSLFKVISPEESTFEGASKLGQAASDIISTAEGDRARLVKPLYTEAYDSVPEILDSRLDELLSKDTYVKQAITSVKKAAINADKPENSTQLLVEARGEISDQIKGAINLGRPAKVRRLTDTYNQLNTILHENNPALRAADEAFAGASGEISELTGTFLKNLKDFSPDKIQNVSQIFNLPAERIKDLRATFQQAGKLDEWNAGIRAHLQTAVESTAEGKNFINKISGNTVQKGKLQAALGDSYDEVAKGLDLESRMFEGKAKYNTGSTTYGNFSENAEFEKGVGVLSKLATGDWKGAIKGLFSNDMPDDVAQKLAKIYFDPKRGKDALDKVIPLLEQYSKNKAFAQGSGKATAGTASKTEGQKTGELTRGVKANQAEAYKNAPEIQELINRIKKNDFQDTTPSVFKPKAKSEPVKTTGGTVKKDEIAKLDGGEFIKKVNTIAEDLETDPDYLLKAINFETGGTISPSIKNKQSGATGLIQFTGKTAQALTGADTKEAALSIMAKMSRTEQLDYVKEHLAPFKGKLDTVEDLYMAILWPKAVGKDSEYELFKEGTKAYFQNKGLDLNEDGVITKAEASKKVKDYQI